MFIEYDQSGQYPLASLTFDEFVGAIVSARRADAGFSRQRLAGMLNITPCQVKEIEAGTRRPSAALIVTILKRFNLSLTDLIHEYTDLFSGTRRTQVYDNVIFISRQRTTVENGLSLN